jgi:squalene synthase HpnC
MIRRVITDTPRVTSHGGEPPPGSTAPRAAETTDSGVPVRAPVDRQAILAKADHENFPVASRLLPRRHRAHLMAVYGFARMVDDIGDEAPPDDRLPLLDDVAADVDRLYAGDDPRIPIVAGLAPTVRATGIPARPLHDLIEANRRDQVVTRYATYDDLLGYCELSANPVGLIVLHIFGFATPHRVTLSDRVCTALQLAEHWQDVAEDLGNGRIYLPQEDLDRFGCTEADLAEPHANERVRALMAFQTDRAARLLDRGAPIVGTLRGLARVAVAGYVAGGRAALAAIRGADHDVLTTTPRPRAARLIPEFARALATTPFSTGERP